MFRRMTLEELWAQRDLWQKAMDGLASGVKSYVIGKRELTRYDLKDIRAMLMDIDRELDARLRGRGRSARMIPYDG